ncbi:Shr3 amino acid permease chaperone [Russula compacta]|nr:Shr3 amino acid permease chaperone [Russula compacta]
MGFRQGVLLATTCFLFGVLLACFTVDYRVLFEPLTEEIVQDGFQYYRTFYNAPPGIKALLHGLIGIGIVAIITKLHRWDESAIFFDGGSLAAFVFATAMYITVTIPAIRTVVTPVEGVDTREDQIEAMRVLSAGNTLIMVLLGGILVLQGGQEWARRLEKRELAKIAGEAEKKEQ